MKKLETLKKALTDENINETLTNIIQCDNIDAKLLTEREKFSVLIYNELAKALNNKTNQLLLDCNYAQSKFHNNGNYKVDYYRFISKDTAHTTMIQIYVNANAKKATCKFRICFSCAKTVREQQEALAKNNFTVMVCASTKRFKTTQRTNIDYTELVSVIKTVCSILSNANTVNNNIDTDK